MVCIKPLGRPSDLAQMGLPEGAEPLAEQCFAIMNKVAFISDPDGNWIEVVPNNIVSCNQCQPMTIERAHLMSFSYDTNVR